MSVQKSFSPLARALVNNYQRHFPLAARPFAKIAARWGVSEQEVMGAVDELESAGALSRIGPVFDHHRAGASTLAAMAIPQSELEIVAAKVSAFAEVNHNYEREHRFNLWFVVTAFDQQLLQNVLGKIEQECGYPVMSLPMLKGFHIDLGFPIDWGDTSGEQFGPVAHPQTRLAVVCLERSGPSRTELSAAQEQQLKALIQGGLSLSVSPYLALAKQIGASEFAVMLQIQHWLDTGLIKRFGLVIKHRAIGYRANAMVVWNVPDAELESVAGKLAASPSVTLCYQRPRMLPDWPYNLFCMIHGRSREAVVIQLERMIEQGQLQSLDKSILFSCKAFKQCGARYYPDNNQEPAPEPLMHQIA